MVALGLIAATGILPNFRAELRSDSCANLSIAKSRRIATNSDATGRMQGCVHYETSQLAKFDHAGVPAAQIAP